MCLVLVMIIYGVDGVWVIGVRIVLHYCSFIMTQPHSEHVNQMI